MPIEVKVLAFGDFLFYIELRAREVLMPYLWEAYKYRITFIRKFLENILSAHLSSEPSAYKNIFLFKVLYLTGFPELY